MSKSAWFTATIILFSQAVSYCTYTRVDHEETEEPHTQTNVIHFVIWRYPEIEIRFWTVTGPDEEAPEIPDRIEWIKITGPAHTTLRGIRVGDSLEQVYEAYGEPDKIEEDTLIYVGIYLRIFFVLDDQGRVTEISLVSYWT